MYLVTVYIAVCEQTNSKEINNNKLQEDALDYRYTYRPKGSAKKCITV